jgi:ParB family chromosome partitioning protein
MIDTPEFTLKDISPERIKRNPDNPRIFFRPEEMDTLMASIRRYGIQVPITVYADGKDYVLIDGERRWRCASKLNFKKIPALVQPKPTELKNLLLMFNIHSLREQWDYLTIAKKLPDVISLFFAESGYEPNELELSEITGLSRGQIRRCKLLLDLPAKYWKILEEELERPKSTQVLSEDFFIEMERALKTVRSRVPAAVPDIDQARDVLIDKFRSDVIGNITDFRMLSKIATSINNLGIKETKARSALTEILSPDNETGIADIYEERFEVRYDNRKIGLNIQSLVEFLGGFDVAHPPTLEPSIIEKLEELDRLIRRVLKG